MIRTAFKLLDPSEYRYLRVIKLQGKEWNYFSGFLFYYRNADNEQQDQLDDAILKSLKSFSIDSELIINEHILMEGQAANTVARYESSTTEEYTIQINPAVNDTLYQLAKTQDIFYYPRKFKVYIHKGLNYSSGLSYFHAYLEHALLEKLIYTMEPVNI